MLLRPSRRRPQFLFGFAEASRRRRMMRLVVVLALLLAAIPTALAAGAPPPAAAPAPAPAAEPASPPVRFDWQGVHKKAQAALNQRDYKTAIQLFTDVITSGR